MRHFLIYSILLLPFLLSAQADIATPEKRCRYRPSREFLLSKDDSCYQITHREADRAFDLRCWDEAMALYRAAKSCTDANQNARSVMNRRIQTCRDSAEQELRNSERLVRRQFLHATAANLANDAKKLLQNYDRSLSYRLADFAGQYVAPGPNADCMQALLDAWYYVPPKIPGNENLQVPFCYQLDYDLGGNVQVRFAGKGKNQKLYAFAPANRQLYAWNAGDMKPVRGMQIEEGLNKFDVSPDGRTLIFYSDQTILLWRSPTETFRVNASNISRWCFSSDGNDFLYFDANESKIYMLETREAYVQRKGEQRPGPRLLVSGVNYPVLGMAWHEGRIWLGGPDSLVVLQRTAKESIWKMVSSVHWNTSATYATDLHLFPEKRAALFTGRESAVYVPLTVSNDLPETAGKGVPVEGTPLAIKQDASLLGVAQSDRDLLYVLTADSGAIRHGAYLHGGENFAPMQGAFSSDNAWLAAATDTGVLKLWALTEIRSDTGISLSGDVRAVFSPNGDRFVRYRDGHLAVFSTSHPDKQLFSIQGNFENAQIYTLGKNWVAYSAGDSIMIVKNGVSGKKWEFPLFESGPLVAFDDQEHFVAYTVHSDSVVIRSLENGEIKALRAFNGYVSILNFIPNIGELMVIQSDFTQIYTDNQIIAKIWNPALPSDLKSPTIRLHGYKIQMSALSPKGTQAAFTDGSDIRVFRLNNLLDENARIRPNGTRFVTAMAFHPDESALAAGYDDGSVIVWDLATSEPRFRLQAGASEIETLSFSSDGSRLWLKTIDDRLFSRDIDPALIRAAAQTEYRRLIAFTPEHIREYGLEKALDQSGNFQRLAESRDLPLVRSFFEYYRQQALSSNNIEHVKSYFESASRLYSRLDDPVTQRALKPTMHEIYEDYIWKLLLRGKNTDATRVAGDFNRSFDKPLAGLKSGAHSALLRKDLAAAARQYADWTIRMYEDPSAQSYFWATLDSLTLKFRQLDEYNLLDQAQTDCICGMYSNVLDIRNMCPPGDVSASVPFDTQTRLRWNIFQKLYTADNKTGKSEKTRLLESAFDDAKTLYRRNAASWRGQLEKTTLALTQSYTEQGVFEQENIVSAMLYKKALRLLDTFGTFKYDEPARLKAIVSNRLKLGDYFMATDKLSEAVAQYESGIEAAGELIRRGPADSLSVWRNDRLAPLLAQLGMARLLEGNADAANNAFIQAFDAFTYGLLPYFFGYVALSADRQEEAMGHFRNITTGRQLADVLAVISRLADRFPAERARLEAFVPRLRQAVLLSHPDIIPDEVDYFFAVLKSAYEASNGNWSSALTWNERGLDAAKKLIAVPDPSVQMKEEYLNAMLTQSFYLLHMGTTDAEAYTKAIEAAEEAEAYASANHASYGYREWLKTNLAHAYLLRRQAGDREKAIAVYRDFLVSVSYNPDNWELLLKDFRDLRRAGVHWPELKEVILAIKPAGIEMTAGEWREIGVEMPLQGESQN